MSRWQQAIRNVAARPGSVLVLLAFGVMALIGIATTVLQLSRVTMLSEAGYGDSYILYDVLQFERTGRIYRDLSEAPYLPAQYSPLAYILLSLPDRVLHHDNEFVGPRLVTIGAFLGCLIATVSITRALSHRAAATVWAAGLVLSVGAMSEWLLQIRADFPGIFCSLMAIRLLMARGGRAMILAGIFAAGAVLFKITLVAAGAAGLVWLAFQRRWVDAMYFGAVAAITVVATYLAYGSYEQQMLPQMLALSPGVADVRGSLRLLRAAIDEPLMPLVLAGIPAALAAVDNRRTLVMVFGVLSGAVAAGTSIQAGANINYYFEPYLAAVPIGVLGLLHLERLSQRFVAVGLVTAFLMTQYVLLPRINGLNRLVTTVASEPSRDEQLEALQQILSRYHTLSTIPRLAIMDRAPALTEPYLLAYLARLKKPDTERLIAKIDSRSFDGVLTTPNPSRYAYRGIDAMDPPLGPAIERTYVPVCRSRELAGTPFILRLPAGMAAADSRLAQDLGRIGCEPVSARPDTPTKRTRR